MVAPLLGLLALGAGAAGSGGINNFLDQNASRNRIRALERGGGTFDPETATQQERLFFGGNRPTTSAQAATDRNQQRNARTAEGSLGLQNEKFDYLQNQNTLAQIPRLNGPVDFNLMTEGLVSMESGGDFTRVNPDSGALGKYQIMPASLAEWAPQYLGEAVTPEQFLANEEIQDQLYQARMGEMVEKHGMRDALSIWHSGRPLEKAIADGADDGNMSTANYVSNQMERYGRKLQEQATTNQGAFVQEYGTELEKETWGNPMSTLQAKQQTWQNAMARTFPPVSAPIGNVRQQQVNKYGAGILDMEPAEVKGLLESETNLTDLLTSLDYVMGTDAKDRLASPAETAAMKSMFDRASLPAMQKFLDAGALQEAEIKLIDRMRGNPFGNFNLSDGEKEVMAGLVSRLQSSRQNELASFGLSAPDIELQGKEGASITTEELAEQAAAAESSQTLQDEADEANQPRTRPRQGQGGNAQDTFLPAAPAPASGRRARGGRAGDIPGQVTR